MGRWIGLAALLLCGAAIAAEFGQADLKKLKEEAAQIPQPAGKPIAPRAADVGEVRKKVLALLPEALRDEPEPARAETLAAMKKALIREDRGIYEVDLNPDGERFLNPDLAVLADGRLIFKYGDVFFRADREELFKQAGLYYQKGPDGIFRYRQGGSEIRPFDAYGLLLTEIFLDGKFKPPLSPEERQSLKALLRADSLVPLSTQALFMGPGPVRLRVFDGARKTLDEIVIPKVEKQYHLFPSTYEEFYRGIRNSRAKPG